MAAKSKLDEELRKTVVDLYRRGMSAKEAAEFAGITTTWLYALLRKSGVEPRNARLAPGESNGTHVADRARIMVQRAVKKGILVPKPCEVCGSDSPLANGQRGIQAHHDDYSKPLDVRWLCVKHHKEWHTHNTPRLGELPYLSPGLLSDHEAISAEEFVSLCNPLGHGWQIRLATHLGVSDRTIRRKVSGECPVTKSEEAEIREYVKSKLKGVKL